MLIEFNVQRIQAFFGDYILLAIVSFHFAIIHVWLYASIVKFTCDVNLLSKFSIIFKEWRVMNNVDRGGAYF